MWVHLAYQGIPVEYMNQANDRICIEEQIVLHEEEFKTVVVHHSYLDAFRFPQPLLFSIHIGVKTFPPTNSVQLYVSRLCII